MKFRLIIQTITFYFLILWLSIISANGQVQNLKNAWRLYNEGENALSAKRNQTAIAKFDSAIKSSSLCITQYLNNAKQMQAKEQICPPVGTVSAADRAHILGNWALNDVATAAFIKGKSAEYLLTLNPQNRTKWERESKTAKILVQELSYGRCFDPQGWFWSPCKGLLGENGCCPNQ